MNQTLACDHFGIAAEQSDVPKTDVPVSNRAKYFQMLDMERSEAVSEFVVGIEIGVADLTL